MGDSHLAKTLAILYNPSAGSGSGERKFHLWKRELESFLNCDFFPSPGPGWLKRLAEECCQKGYGGVVAVGGDGTLHEVLNGLDLQKKIPLGLFPLGTENVFARAHKIPTDPLENARYLINAQVKNLDVGLANGVRFLTMCGIGFDAVAVEQVSLGLKKWMGPLAYVASALKAAFIPGKIHPFSYKFNHKTGTLPFCVASLIPFYGGGLRVAPEADPYDGLLDLVLFKTLTPYLFIKNCFQMWTTYHPLKNQKGIHREKIKGARFYSEKPVPFQCDGEWAGSLPLELSILPGGLRVFLP